MPSCFTLYPIGKKEPAILQDVDAELCAQFLEPVTDKWFHGWYNGIGFPLSVGLTFDEILEDMHPGSLAFRITTYLKEHYTVNSWRE